MKNKKEAIVFIDGNNLYHNLKASMINPGDLNLRKLSEFVCKHFNCNWKKTIYYNSLPDIRDGEEKYYRHLKYIEKIRILDNFEVKTRKLQRSSNIETLEDKKRIISDLGLCKLCKPIVESNCADCIGNVKIKEKGIDVMLAVDMINLSLIKKECDYCILISGDADFVPAMDLIKTGGKIPVSATLYKGYSYELRKKHGWFILDRRMVLDKLSN